MLLRIRQFNQSKQKHMVTPIDTGNLVNKNHFARGGCRHIQPFLLKNLYMKNTLFRLDCGINADYELMLRFLEVHKISTVWLKKVCTNMEAGGGTSNNGLQSRIAGMNNDKLAWEKNGLKPGRVTILLKKLRKLPQFVGAKFVKIVE